MADSYWCESLSSSGLAVYAQVNIQVQKHTLPFGEPAKPPFSVVNGRPAKRRNVSTLLVNGLTLPASLPTGVKKPVSTIFSPGFPLLGEVSRGPRLPVNWFCCRNKYKYPAHARNAASRDTAIRACMLSKRSKY